MKDTPEEYGGPVIRRRALDFQNITFHDSRTGWALTAEDIKEFNAACTRWLIKKNPAYAKARQKKFGQL